MHRRRGRGGMRGGCGGHHGMEGHGGMGAGLGLEGLLSGGMGAGGMMPIEEVVQIAEMQGMPRHVIVTCLQYLLMTGQFVEVEPGIITPGPNCGEPADPQLLMAVINSNRGNGHPGGSFSGRGRF